MSSYDFWAILPDAVPAAQFALDRADEALAADGFEREADPLVADYGNMRVIRVHGVMIAKEYPEWACQWAGLCVTGRIQRRIEAAAADPSVGKVLLDINSPGGMVTGIAELAAAIEACNKPIVAHVSGVCASAAYWTAAAANNISVDPTGMMGSVGVVTVHYKEDEERLETVSSQTPKKRGDVFAENKKEREQARAEVQRVVDDLAGEFISYIEKRRGDHGEAADGRIEIGAKAVDAGFADMVYLKHQLLAFIERLKMPKEDRSKMTAAERETPFGHYDDPGPKGDPGPSEPDRATGPVGEPGTEGEEGGRIQSIIALNGPAQLTVKAIGDGWSVERASREFIQHYKNEAAAAAENRNTIKRRARSEEDDMPPAVSAPVLDETPESLAADTVKLYRRVYPRRTPTMKMA